MELCNDFTQFQTFLQLFDGQRNEIAQDSNGCGQPGFQSIIDIQSGSTFADDYMIGLSSADFTQFGPFRIEVNCLSSEPTASPTTEIPSLSPTKSPTPNPTENPTLSPIT